MGSSRNDPESRLTSTPRDLDLKPGKSKHKTGTAGPQGVQSGIFMAKYSATGKLVWGREDVVEQGGRDTVFWGLAVDKKLRLLAAGGLGTNLVLKDGPTVENRNGQTAGIVLRFDSQGKLK